MVVLLTGATGLIGKEVGKLLAQHGHTVHAVTRKPESARLELPFPAKLFKWSGEAETFPAEALDGVEAIIHLAGEPVAEGRWTDEKKRRIRDSRVLGTRKLIEAIHAHPTASTHLKTYLQGSAVGYYGNRGDEPLTESSAGDSSGFLSKVVADWEAEADTVRDDSRFQSVRLTKIRTGIVLSRRGGALGKMLSVFTKGLGGKIGSGQQWISWVHIVDISRLFVFALETDSIQGVFNGTAPEPARNERFTVALARAVGRSVFLPVPETALKLALGELAQEILGGQRVLPERVLEAGFQFQYPELVPALEELGEPFRGGQHEFVSEQWLPQKPEEIFGFFSRETNLEKITPPSFALRILGKSTPQLEEGTLIDYRLSILGVPMKWQTRIESWQPNKAFVDIQLKGPYQLWHHTHEFHPLAGGTLVKDRVLYRLPLGIVGDTAASWRVGRDVEEIFAYRKRQIGELIGSQQKDH